MSFLDDMFGGVESLVSDTWDNVQSFASDTNQTFDQLYSQDFLGGLNSFTEDVLGNAESLVNDEGYQQAATAALMYYGANQGGAGGGDSSFGDMSWTDYADMGMDLLGSTNTGQAQGQPAGVQDTYGQMLNRMKSIFNNQNKIDPFRDSSPMSGEYMTDLFDDSDFFGDHV